VSPQRPIRSERAIRPWQTLLQGPGLTERLPILSILNRTVWCHDNVTAISTMDRHLTTLTIMPWVTSWELILLVAAVACLAGSFLLM
jgi:hypothetical protein